MPETNVFLWYLEKRSRPLFFKQNGEKSSGRSRWRCRLRRDKNTSCDPILFSLFLLYGKTTYFISPGFSQFSLICLRVVGLSGPSSRRHLHLFSSSWANQAHQGSTCSMDPRVNYTIVPQLGPWWRTGTSFENFYVSVPRLDRTVANRAKLRICTYWRWNWPPGPARQMPRWRIGTRPLAR